MGDDRNSTSTAEGIGMKYRFLGNSGLLVSRFAIGCYVFNNEAEIDKYYEIFKHGYANGINFWDTAEFYNVGASERVVGMALQRGIDEGVWTREDLVISTKLYFWKDGPNSVGLSRKHLIEGMKASLKRLGTEYTDVVFCHRPEKFTPIEEVVRAMNFIINQGWAFYWGTSEWMERDIHEACEVADRLGLIRPIVEQPAYNVFERSKVEVEFSSLYKKYKLGLTTWSPLAFGILTGKHSGKPIEGTRLAEVYEQGRLPNLLDQLAQVDQLRPIAAELGCSIAQLALAWVAANENVTTVLLGASSFKQMDENLQAFPFVSKLTPEIMKRIDEIVPLVYKPSTYDSYYSFREKFL